MHCPTLDELTAATLDALPRGRAWQNNDGGPRPGQEVGFAPGAFDNEVFSTTQESPSWLYRYWRSFAVVLQYLTQRLCDLRMEFWCQTVNETLDEWMTEYGLPDSCDPFPDLCTKVAAIGGTRCDYYATVAARSGWSISCNESIAFCGTRASGARAFAGNAKAGSTLGLATLRIVIHQQDSPALAGIGRYLPAVAGRLRAGRRQTCGAILLPLQCILSRIVHAEIQQVYEVDNGP